MRDQETVDATTTNTHTPEENLKNTTAYVVLSKIKATLDNGTEIDGWKWEDNVMATSAEAAIKAASTTEGTYVAIPARSFKPVKLVKKETVTFDITPV